MSSCQNLPLRSPRPAVESEELLLLLSRKRLRLRLLLEDPLLVGLRVEGSHGPVDSTVAEDGGGGRRGGGRGGRMGEDERGLLELRRGRDRRDEGGGIVGRGGGSLAGAPLLPLPSVLMLVAVLAVVLEGRRIHPP